MDEETKSYVVLAIIIIAIGLFGYAILRSMPGQISGYFPFRH